MLVCAHGDICRNEICTFEIWDCAQHVQNRGIRQWAHNMLTIFQILDLLHDLFSYLKLLQIETRRAAAGVLTASLWREIQEITAATTGIPKIKWFLHPFMCAPSQNQTKPNKTTHPRIGWSANTVCGFWFLFSVTKLTLKPCLGSLSTHPTAGNVSLKS